MSDIAEPTIYNDWERRQMKPNRRWTEQLNVYEVEIERLKHECGYAQREATLTREATLEECLRLAETLPSYKIAAAIRALKEQK